MLDADKVKGLGRRASTITLHRSRPLQEGEESGTVNLWREGRKELNK
jgi:hypothetical protein